MFLDLHLLLLVDLGLLLLLLLRLVLLLVLHLLLLLHLLLVEVVLLAHLILLLLHIRATHHLLLAHLLLTHLLLRIRLRPVEWLLLAHLLLLFILHLLLNARLFIKSIGLLSQHVVGLEHADFALVKLYKWVKFHILFAEDQSFLEAHTEATTILEILNCADLYVNEAADDVSLTNVMHSIHILEGWLLVRDHLAREGITIE